MNGTEKPIRRHTAKGHRSRRGDASGAYGAGSVARGPGNHGPRQHLRHSLARASECKEVAEGARSDVQAAELVERDPHRLVRAAPLSLAVGE